MDYASRPQFEDWAAPSAGLQDLEFLEARGPGGVGYAGQAGRQTSLNFQQQQQQQAGDQLQQPTNQQPGTSTRQQEQPGLSQQRPPWGRSEQEPLANDQQRPGDRLASGSNVQKQQQQQQIRQSGQDLARSERLNSQLMVTSDRHRGGDRMKRMTWKQEWLVYSGSDDTLWYQLDIIAICCLELVGLAIIQQQHLKGPFRYRFAQFRQVKQMHGEYVHFHSPADDFGQEMCSSVVQLYGNCLGSNVVRLVRSRALAICKTISRLNLFLDL